MISAQFKESLTKVYLATGEFTMLKRNRLLSAMLALSATFAVYADADQAQPMQLANQRIFLLESAFAPTSPQAVVNTFADAVVQRNAAVQYMLFCPALQQQYLDTFQSMNWVSGTSSPSIASFVIKKQALLQFTIHYAVTLQNQPAGTLLDQLTLSQVTPASNASQHFCISAYTRIPHLAGAG